MRGDNLVAFNPYYVNGHSPCMPEGRRALEKSRGSLFEPRVGDLLALRAAIPGKQPNAKPKNSTPGPEGARLRGEAGHGEAVTVGLSKRAAQHTKSPLPALLHKGRVLFVCKEAYLDVVTKFTNSLMKGGNQQKAEGILRRCRMFIKIKGKKTSKFLYQAIQNVKPLAELRTRQTSKGSRRKQKSTPAPISQKRGIKLAIQ